MHAIKVIRSKIEKNTQQSHKARRNALWRAVAGLLLGGMLWPAAIGRHRPGNATDKNSIKAIDRLLGNFLLYAELKLFYAAILNAILKLSWTPVVLVDITEIRDKVFALTASLAHDGRGIPIYSEVGSKKAVSNRHFKQRFLRSLKQIFPPDVTPIITTDAGFQSPWFDDVEEVGWDYVGRVRHQTKFHVDDDWLSCSDLHKKAKKQARDLGEIPFPQKKPKARRMVLAKKRKSKGRRRANKTGTKGKTANDRRCTKSAREPWLLATSLTCDPTGVVNVYALRMQIEENYRDVKNKRWGWALDHYASKDHSRFQILLLIAALGVLVQHSVGCAGENRQLQYSFQANTVRNRRVLSIFVLGGLLLKARNAGRLTNTDIVEGFTELCQRIRTLEQEIAR